MGMDGREREATSVNRYRLRSTTRSTELAQGRQGGQGRNNGSVEWKHWDDGFEMASSRWASAINRGVTI